MNGLMLARWQFAALTIYHFFFVPVTLGLSIFLAIMETKYVTSGNEKYKKMVKFWGKLFLINFALGVVTGLLQEFQFGMNWAGYSRFMGDIFGAPLAIEALLAFYIESTFLGVWVFGWDKLSKKWHAAMIWLVAIGSNLSALWILVANSFMQEPVGYTLNHGRAEMTNFLAIATNTHVLYQFPHVLSAGITTAGFLVLGVSAYRLLRGSGSRDFFYTSLRWAAVYALIGAILVAGIGHFQGQHEVQVQPMKMAAAEALWETQDPASLSLFSAIDTRGRRNIFEIGIPHGLSLLSYNTWNGEVKGLNDLQAEFEQKYGPGDYIPNVPLVYWSFRIMVGVGLLLILFALYALYLVRKEGAKIPRWFLIVLAVSTFLPFVATSTGWLVTEIGRQPWIVYGLQQIEDAVSPNVPASSVLFSFLSLGVLYTILIIVEATLMVRAAKSDPDVIESPALAQAQ